GRGRPRRLSAGDRRHRGGRGRAGKGPADRPRADRDDQEGEPRVVQDLNQTPTSPGAATMDSDEDRVRDLLRGGYAAPPPPEAFVEWLGLRLVREWDEARRAARRSKARRLVLIASAAAATVVAGIGLAAWARRPIADHRRAVEGPAVALGPRAKAASR